MGSPNNKAIDVQDSMREAICQIRGVLYAQLVFQEDEPTEIHIVSTSERGPKQIARDIESLLLARFQLKIDHKIISVAQMEENVKLAAHEAGVRLVCEGFGMTIQKSRIQSSVMLSYLDEQVQGVAIASLDIHARNRVMVDATLDAVHKFMKKDDIFSLLEFKTVSALDTSVVMVCLSCGEKNGNDLLVGTAFMKGDPQKCIISATLDAINRKVSLLV